MHPTLTSDMQVGTWFTRSSRMQGRVDLYFTTRTAGLSSYHICESGAALLHFDTRTHFYWWFFLSGVQSLFL